MPDVAREAGDCGERTTNGRYREKTKKAHLVFLDDVLSAPSNHVYSMLKTFSLTCRHNTAIACKPKTDRDACFNLEVLDVYACFPRGCGRSCCHVAAAGYVRSRFREPCYQGRPGRHRCACCPCGLRALQDDDPYARRHGCDGSYTYRAVHGASEVIAREIRPLAGSRSSPRSAALLVLRGNAVSVISRRG